MTDDFKSSEPVASRTSRVLPTPGSPSNRNCTAESVAPIALRKSSIAAFCFCPAESLSPSPPAATSSCGFESAGLFHLRQGSVTENVGAVRSICSDSRQRLTLQCQHTAHRVAVILSRPAGVATQELPRKLLPTRAEEPQTRRHNKCQFTRRCLLDVGSNLDLKRAHNPLYRVQSYPRDHTKWQGFNVHWGRESVDVRVRLVLQSKGRAPQGSWPWATRNASVHFHGADNVSNSSLARRRSAVSKPSVKELYSSLTIRRALSARL
jgi:hypothetical protein